MSNVKWLIDETFLIDTHQSKLLTVDTSMAQLTRGEVTYDAVLNAEAELILDVRPLDEHLNYRSTRDKLQPHDRVLPCSLAHTHRHLNYRSTRDQLQPHDRVLPCSLVHTQTRIYADTENRCESKRHHYTSDCNFFLHYFDTVGWVSGRASDL